MNSIEKIGKMIEDDSVATSVLLAPLSNITEINISKDNGFITFGVPVDVAKNLSLKDSYYIGGLLLVEKEQFEKYKGD